MGEAQTLNVVDIVAILALCLGLFMGYRRKLSGELARLISILAAFGLTIVFYRPVGAWVFTHTRMEDRPAQAVAFILTIVAALLAMVLLRIFLKRIMQVVFEETTDKVGGAFAGLIRTALTIVIVFMMVNTWPHDYLNRQFGEESVVGRLVLRYIPAVRARLADMPVTEKMKDKLKESKDELARKIEEELSAPSRSDAREEQAEQPRRRWFTRRPTPQENER